MYNDSTIDREIRQRNRGGTTLALSVYAIVASWFAIAIASMAT